jgi:hypothetical protein
MATDGPRRWSLALVLTAVFIAAAFSPRARRPTGSIDGIVVDQTARSSPA